MCSEGYCSWVCVSINWDLIFGTSVLPEHNIMYSTGNKGQKNVWISLKLLRCRDILLPALHGYLCSQNQRMKQDRMIACNNECIKVQNPQHHTYMDSKIFTCYWNANNVHVQFPKWPTLLFLHPSLLHLFHTLHVQVVSPLCNLSSL